MAHEQGQPDAQGRDVRGAVLLDGEEVDDEDELRREEDLYKEALRDGEAHAKLVGDEERPRDEAPGQAGGRDAGYYLDDEDDNEAVG